VRDRLLFHEEKAQRHGFSRVAGIDEAGRGPLAGPVVAACVLLGDRALGVRVDDSKRLSARQRDRAFIEIRRRAAVGIGIVPEGYIDEVNIYRATLRAMELAVLDLRTRPDLLLIDGRMRLRIDCEQWSIVGGDGASLSIAAASVVAKVTRDRLLRFYHTLFPAYGFDRHKGYGTERHRRAVAANGLCPLHRRSFSWERPGRTREGTRL